MAWLSGYSYRKKITIDYTKVSADLAYFPVVITLTNDTDVGGHALSTGYDIRFTSSDETTLLNYERASFAIATGSCSAIFWVCVPALSDSENTILYIYYGKSDATDGQNITGTWSENSSSNYKHVYHLVQDPSGSAPQVLNSASGSNDGTCNGMIAGDLSSSGKIGKCYSFNGSSKYVNGTAIPTGDVFTVEAWINTSGTGVSQPIAEYTNSTSDRHGVAIHSSNKPRITYPNSYREAGSALSTSTWYHLVACSDGTNFYVYQNGSSLTVGGVETSSESTASIFRIGRSANTQTLYFNGLIDEVRISSSVRALAWIVTCYNNQNAPSTFSTITPIEYVGLSSSSSGTGSTTCVNKLTKFETTTATGGAGSSTANNRLLLRRTATGSGSSGVATASNILYKKETTTPTGTGSTTATNRKLVFKTATATGGIGSRTANNILYKKETTTPTGTGATTATNRKLVFKTATGTGSSGVATSVNKLLLRRTATGTGSSGVATASNILYKKETTTPTGTGSTTATNRKLVFKTATATGGTGSITSNNRMLVRRTSTGTGGTGVATATNLLYKKETTNATGTGSVTINTRVLLPRTVTATGGVGSTSASNIKYYKLSTSPSGSGSTSILTWLYKFITTSPSGTGVSTATVEGHSQIDIESSASGVGETQTTIWLYKYVTDSCSGIGSSSNSNRLLLLRTATGTGDAGSTSANNILYLSNSSTATGIGNNPIYSDNSNNSIIPTLNNITYTTDNRGRNNKALAISSTITNADFGTSAVYNITGAITLSAWVKITNLGLSSRIVTKGRVLTGGGNYGYGLAFYTTNKSLRFDTFSSSTNDHLESEANVLTETTNWHHIVGVWDGTTNANGKKIYLDGNQIAQKTSGISSIGVNTYNVYVGRDQGSNSSSCNIAEVRIYSRALSPQEVSALFSDSYIDSSNLVALFKVPIHAQNRLLLSINSNATGIGSVSVNDIVYLRNSATGTGSAGVATSINRSLLLETATGSGSSGVATASNILYTKLTTTATGGIGSTSCNAHVFTVLEETTTALGGSGSISANVLLVTPVTSSASGGSGSAIATNRLLLMESSLASGGQGEAQASDILINWLTSEVQGNGSIEAHILLYDYITSTATGLGSVDTLANLISYLFVETEATGTGSSSANPRLITYLWITTLATGLGFASATAVSLIDFQQPLTVTILPKSRTITITSKSRTVSTTSKSRTVTFV